MPIDPSIISNAFANISMPDMNALMQQRVQGAQNIYQIETGRQEQAAQAEKEAAKAQEDAAVKALLPAYAHAFKTGDMRGALKFAPPQYQDGLLPYVEALDGRPLEEIQSALTGSLVTSEPGRAFLENLNRMTTAGIQQGQLDVSRQDLVLRRQKQALDARGEGEWKLQEAEGGFFWTNPRSREVVPADVTGGAVPGPAPDVVTPRQPAPGMPEVAQPPAFRPKPKTTGGEITQGERRAASLLDNVVRNAGAVNQVITETPEAFQPTAVEAASGFLPWGERQAAAWQQTPERKIVYNRMLQSIDALLTLATGAAYTKPQLEAQLGAYLPGFFDENAVKRDKVLALRDRIESEKINAGRAWTPEQDAKAEEVFRQFETLAETMSQGVSAEDAGEVDTSNPYLTPEGN
jgi:hypothetical protein